LGIHINRKERDMRKYYYSNGVNRVGPVSLLELRSLPEVTAGTLVWYEGLPSWVRADSLPELSGVVSPLPLHAVDFPRSSETEGEDIYVGVAVVLVIMIVGIAIVLLL
jgi:hypothetical protein